MFAETENAESAPYLISLFYKSMFSWYFECTQLKVDLLQFKMMYYSYLYDQKLRNILSTFHCYQEKLQVIVQVAVLVIFQSMLNSWKNYESNFVVNFLGLITWKVK